MTADKIIALAEPALGEEEKEAVASVIESGWLTMGERVARFEREFAELHGAQNAVAVSSCTAALHLLLASLGLGPGDEVLVPSLTFVATVNAVCYVGAKPVFVDIERETEPHISLQDAAKKVTRHTRAVIVMHYGGYVIDMKEWRRFADERSLLLIEDAAHAPGAEGVGTLSDGAAFSFFTNKNMTTSEGGMALARDSETLERVRLLRSHGMTSTTMDREKGHAHGYNVTAVGYNYRLDELRASIGLTQIKRLPLWNERRRELTALYRGELEEIEGVDAPFAGWAKTAAHLMPVLLPPGADGRRVMSEMRNRGVQCSMHYPPVHLFSVYRKMFPAVSLPETERFCQRELTLPLHPGLADEDVATVAAALHESLQGEYHAERAQAGV